jgi:hypothetical protein
VTTQSTSLRLADQLSRAPYAWPGGYPRFAVTRDGAVLCNRCCATERATIATTTGDDGWCITALDINWEDQHLYCDHCSRQIEAAYGK